ncbi:MAG: hypothetical protein KGJ57_05285 [Sphingomonadales bacterium]|nr:hypothetical protein [Sphingomonadales bacterium]MDE2168829.1 hypothetical protein [Sphingomonadales bacterium]
MVSFRSAALRAASMAIYAAAAAPAILLAQSGQSSKPVTDNNPDARAVAETPLTDLNVKKGEIPPILLRAQQEPYTLAGLKSCKAIVREVGRLNSVLGDDVDIAGKPKPNTSPGHVAQSVVGSFIPFRGVIREVSGASAEQRRMNAAIQAGMARRGFLKGVGLMRHCPYPARPG